MLKKLSITLLTSVLLFTGVGSAFAHQVKSGDTMYRIAVNHDISLKDLGVLNPHVKDLDLIYVGQTIKTNSNNSQAVSKPVSKPVSNTIQSSTSAEMDLLSRLVFAEARSESYEGKVAVAKVVLNRVASSQFPNSIYAVIHQKGQFSPVTNGSIYNKADSDSFKAVEEALTTNLYSNALFFYNPTTATSRWLDGRTTVFIIENHVFKE